MEFLELTEEEFRNYLNKSEERTFLQTIKLVPFCLVNLQPTLNIPFSS